MHLQSMYVRVKRNKTTIFLHVEPTDTVLEVKQKLQELVQQVLQCIGPKTRGQLYTIFMVSAWV